MTNDNAAVRFGKAHLAIVALLALYAALAWLGIDGKSATYDEPLHTASSLAVRQLGDYRVDPEDPALFKRWMALLQPHRPLPTDVDLWGRMNRDPAAQWAWSVLTIYGGNDGSGPATIARARAMMLIVAVLIGALTATWAWQIAGPTAGVIAAAVFAFDPLLLAHGPIAKNDGIATLAFVLTAYTLWQVGRRPTLAWVAALAASVALAMTVKFSGVLLAGLVPFVLVVGALLPGRFALARRLTRALGISAVVGVVAFVAIWASYGFRYAPTPDGSFAFDLVAQSRHSPWLRTIDRYHLLPQAYTYGLAYTIHSAVARHAFLVGHTSKVGWWYYFPVAMAVKTPLATIAAAVLACGSLIPRLHRLRLRGETTWTLLALALPAAVYTAVAMNSNLNIGVRHMLPVYPLAFVGIAVMLHRWRKTAIALGVVLAVESFVAFPNYLPYFNAAAGGSRGGLRLLSDSNLDWGQDLTLLADWQRANSHRVLYLSYFGTADPASYGVRYTPVAAGYAFIQQRTMPTTPGVIAVSATHLQGMYVRDEDQPFYAALRSQTPVAVLGGSIYLYEWAGR